jgi:hypothetical protein
MRLIGRLTKLQKTLAAVVLGLALTALGTYLMTLGGSPVYGPAGQFGLTLGPVRPEWMKPWLRVVIWLVLAGAWALAAVGVLRHETGEAEHGASDCLRPACVG